MRVQTKLPAVRSDGVEDPLRRQFERAGLDAELLARLLADPADRFILSKPAELCLERSHALGAHLYPAVDRIRICRRLVCLVADFGNNGGQIPPN